MIPQEYLLNHFNPGFASEPSRFFLPLPLQSKFAAHKGKRATSTPSMRIRSPSLYLRKVEVHHSIFSRTNTQLIGAKI